jgi:hypothetical protein
MNKDMKRLTKDDKETIERLLSLSKLSTPDVNEMQRVMASNVDPKLNVCTTCSSQIRYVHQTLKYWYDRYNITYGDEVIEVIEVFKDYPTVHSCTECGVELTDKRRKVCKECKGK